MSGTSKLLTAVTAYLRVRDQFEAAERAEAIAAAALGEVLFDLIEPEQGLDNERCVYSAGRVLHIARFPSDTEQYAYEVYISEAVDVTGGDR